MPTKQLTQIIQACNQLAKTSYSKIPNQWTQSIMSTSKQLHYGFLRVLAKAPESEITNILNRAVKETEELSSENGSLPWRLHKAVLPSL